MVQENFENIVDFCRRWNNKEKRESLQTSADVYFNVEIEFRDTLQVLALLAHCVGIPPMQTPTKQNAYENDDRDMYVCV